MLSGSLTFTVPKKVDTKVKYVPIEEKVVILLRENTVYFKSDATLHKRQRK